MREDIVRLKSSVVRLVDLVRMKGSFEKGLAPAYPFIIAIANLLFCAYLEQYLRIDAGTHYLDLFMYLEAGVWILLTIGYFVRTVNPILLKTSVFPLTSLIRYLFALAANLRRPVMVGLWSTSLLCLIVLYRHTLVVAVTAAIVYSFMILVLSSLATSILFIFLRFSRPAAGAGVFALFCLFALLAGTYVLQVSSLLGSVPVVAQAASALVAIRTGEFQSAGWNVGWLMIIFVAAMLFGKKFA